MSLIADFETNLSLVGAGEKLAGLEAGKRVVLVPFLSRIGSEDELARRGGRVEITAWAA